MASCVRSSTRFELELRAQVSMLRRMQLVPPFDQLPSNIGEFDQRRIELYNRMGEGCSTMLAGPKPNIDYGAISAELPKITAEIEYIDHSSHDLTASSGNGLCSAFASSRCARIHTSRSATGGSITNNGNSHTADHSERLLAVAIELP
jgi:hypothetical protein